MPFWHRHVSMSQARSTHGPRPTAGSVSDGMELLHGGYARAYNRRHGRRGVLFESRFNASRIKDHAHFFEVIRYVARNPVAAGLVERRLHATRCAAATGSTISAAIKRIPTMRIETPIVSAASIDTSPFKSGTGSPATTAPSSSSATATSARSSTAIVSSAPRPSTAITARSLRETVRIEPNRYANRFAFSAPAAEMSTTPPAMPV